MKKIIILLSLVLIMSILYKKVNASEVVIPDSAIRVRVIANSNSLYDQNIKLKVTDYIENYLQVLLIDCDSIEDARDVIKNSIDDVNNGIKELFYENNYDYNYSINFGDNYFPNKEYKGVKYNAGYYESLVVTIGSGNGDNWWCCLFPPLCLLEADESESDDVEYKFWVKDLIDRYL